MKNFIVAHVMILEVVEDSGSLWLRMPNLKRYVDDLKKSPKKFPYDN